jgi:hypothetical protein
MICQRSRRKGGKGYLIYFVVWLKGPPDKSANAK